MLRGLLAVLMVSVVAVLAPTGAVSGEAACGVRVEFLAEGPPVTAQVRVLSNATSEVVVLAERTARTDESSEFGGLPCEALLTFQVGEYFNGLLGNPIYRTWEEHSLLTSARRQTLRIPLPPLRAIVVEAQDSEGRPLNDVLVTLRAPFSTAPSQRYAYAAARTAADGFARAHVLAGTSYDVRVERDSDEILLFWDDIPVDALPATRDGGVLRLVLEARCRIEGTIKDPAGAPVSNVEVHYQPLSGKSGGAATISDDEGRFRLSPSMGCPVKLVPKDPQRRWEFDPSERTLADEGHFEVAFTAIRADQESIDLVLLDPEDAAVPSGLTVNAYTRCDGELVDYVSCVSDREGRCRIPCEPGCDLEISVERAPGQRWLRTLHEERDTRCRDIELALRHVTSVHGTVEDLVGNPLRGVLLTSSAGALVAATDDEGRFRLGGLSPAEQRLTLAERSIAGFERPLLGRQTERGMRDSVVDPETQEGPLRLVVTEAASLCVENPEGGVWGVALYPEQGAARTGAETPWRLSETGCLDDLYPGLYRVLIFDPTGWHVPGWWSQEDTRREPPSVLLLREGENFQMSLSLHDAGRIILDAAGAPPLARDARYAIRAAPEQETPADSWEALLSPFQVTLRPAQGERIEEVLLNGIPAGRWEIGLCADDWCEAVHSLTWAEVRAGSTGSASVVVPR